jgi:hypothetical protein
MFTKAYDILSQFSIYACNIEGLSIRCSHSTGTWVFFTHWDNSNANNRVSPNWRFN